MTSLIYRTSLRWLQSFSPLSPGSTVQTYPSAHWEKPPTTPVRPPGAPTCRFHIEVKLYPSTIGCFPAVSSRQYSTSTPSSSGPYLKSSSSPSHTYYRRLNCKTYKENRLRLSASLVLRLQISRKKLPASCYLTSSQNVESAFSISGPIPLFTMMPIALVRSSACIPGFNLPAPPTTYFLTILTFYRNDDLRTHVLTDKLFYPVLNKLTTKTSMLRNTGHFR